jgi:tape measure domain-containing protein
MATERLEIIITSRGLGQTQRAINRVGKEASTTRGALAFMRAALVVVASARVVAGIAQQLDLFTALGNRLRLVTNDVQELTAVQDALFLIAQKTRQSFEETVVVFQRLAQSTGKLKLDYKELLELTELVNIAVALSGASAQSAAAGLRQFAQGLASGVTQGDELRSVVENLPFLADVIGRQFGIAGGELLAFNKANPGIIKTRDIVEALRKEAPRLLEEFKNSSKTIGQGFEVLSNSLTFFFGKLSQATGAGRFFADSLIVIADNIDKVVVALASLVGIVAFNFLIAQVAVLHRTLALLVGFALSSFVSLGRVLVLPFTLAVQAAVPLLGIMRVLGTTVLATVAQFARFIGITVIMGGLRTAVLGVTAAMAALRAVTLTLVLLAGVSRAAAAGFVVMRTAGLGLAALQGILGGIRIALVAIARAVFLNPLFIGGALIIGGLVVAFFLLRDRIEAVIDSLGGIRNVFNTVVAGAGAAVQTIIQNFSQLPRAIKDIAIQAANFLIENFEKAVNGAISLLNNLPGIDIEFVDFGRIENDAAGAAANVKKFFIESFDEIKRSDPLEITKQKVEDLINLLKSFTSGAINLDALLASLEGKLPKAVGGNLSDIQKLKGAYKSLLQEISPLAKEFFELKVAQELVAEAQKAGIDTAKQFGLTHEEILRRVQRNLAGFSTDLAVMEEEITIVWKAVLNGAGSVEEALRKIRDIQIAFLEDQVDLGSGIERTFLKLQREVEDVASAIEDAMNTAFKSAEDAVVEFVQTGRIQVGTLAKDIHEQLLRGAVKALIADLGAALGLGQKTSGSLLGDVFGNLFGRSGGGGGQLPFDFPGFASGGSFNVGPGNSLGQLPGVDNRLVAFRARDGENVSVARPGQGHARPVNVNFTVMTPDANSFRRSQGQIMNDAQIALRRANLRNG